MTFQDPTTCAADVIEHDMAAIAACDLPWEQLSGCCIAVTGAGGFLGGYLVRALLALHRLGKVSRPLQVVALVRSVDRALEAFGELAGDKQLTLQHWDLNTLGVPELGDVHYIVHAASQASPRFYAIDPLGTILPNTVGTIGLLRALERSADPKGLMYVSSGDVYGGIETNEPLHEDRYGPLDPTLTRSCYAEGKRAGEAICAAWARQHQPLSTWIVRPAHSYGPGLKADDGRVFSDFAYNVARGENIVMNSDGTARRAFCYVTDVITGFFTVLLKGLPGVPYNVANAGAELSVIELAELLKSLFPERKIQIVRGFAAENRPAALPGAFDRRVPDTARLEALGWHPEVTPAEGFTRMIRAIQ
jgi:dTDP-glucose 4,6-dehydratase